MLGELLGSLFLGSIGIVLVVLGYMVWKKEKISLLHDYHYDKVEEEDKKHFVRFREWEFFLLAAELY